MLNDLLNHTNALHVLLAIWFFTFTIFITRLLWMSRRKAHLSQIYDDCSSFNSYFKYVGIIRLGESSADFDWIRSYVLLDLLDVRDRFITRIALPPSWINKRSISKSSIPKSLREFKFQLNRSNKLPDIGSVRICHDCYTPFGSSLWVDTFELSYPEQGYRIITLIQRSISVLPPDALPWTQVFCAQAPQPGVCTEPLNFDAQECVLSAAHVSLSLFVMANVSYCLSLLAAVHGDQTVIQLTFMVGVSYLLGSLVMINLQLLSRLLFQTTKPQQTMTDKSVSTIQTSNISNNTSKKTYTSTSISQKFILLLILALIGSCLGLFGYSLANQLSSNQLRLWVILFCIMGMISIFISLIVITLLRLFYYSRFTKVQSLKQTEPIKSINQAQEKQTLTCYVDLVAIGQTPEIDEK